jgi:acyl-CoA synthetase (AMP-forming)/AMP-acid ligase II
VAVAAEDTTAGARCAPWLYQRLEEFGEAAAIVHRGAPITYRALLARAASFDAELAARGIGPGCVVLLEGSYSEGAVALLLALLRRGAICVPLTPQAAVQREAFAKIAEVAFRYRFDNDGPGGAERCAFEALPGGQPSLASPLLQRLASLGHPGLVLFSSGSTGRPKAVLHDCAVLLEKFHKPGQRKTTLSFLLFDHIGGIDTLFNTLANGGTLVTTPARDPDTVCAAIAAHRVHTLPASPTFLNLLLLSEAHQRHDLSSLRVLAYGTEPMPEPVLARLHAALPFAKLVQTYGLSELGVLRTRSRGESLWLQFSGDGFATQVRDGVLWVKARTAMLGYLNAPDLFDAEGWLNTEDAVEVDGEWLRVLGRVSDLINVGGRKVYPAEVEAVLLQLPNVRDVAVFGEKNPLTGQAVSARFNLLEPEPLDAFKKRLRAFCKDKLPSYKVPARIELTDREQFNARLKKLRRTDGGTAL